MKMYPKIKENRGTLAALLLLAWPTVLEELLSTVIQYIDTAMVGHLGADATATVSLSSTYTWLINSMIYAIGIGFLSYIARAVGEGNQQKIKTAAGQAVSAALVIGGVLTVATLIVAPYMPVWMGADESIRHDATIYFIWINAPMLFRSAMSIFGSVLRATGDTKTPMLVNVFINIVNTGLNYIFIYLLGYGAVGAGIATAISYCVGGVLMTMAFAKNSRLQFSIQNIRLNKTVMWACLSVGIPIMLTQIASCSGYIVATSFVSSMATAVYAAHAIAITAETIFYIPGYGMQAATSTLIGNAIGERNRKKEKGVIFWSIAVIFSLMCVTGVLLFFGAEFMMGLFTTDEEVIRIGTRLLRIVAFTEPIFGSAAVLEGIFDGMGRTKYPFAVTLLTRWGVRIFGSYLCVRVFNYGIDQIWYCMIGDNILKAILLALGVVYILRKGEENKLW
jgi:putative MATE family efflux protein